MTDRPTEQRAMRAWRTHQYGQPCDVKKLEMVPVPEPGPGEVLVRTLAIPLNLNDMERVTGGNMMARPELPSIAGMEVMGVIDACGEGTAEWAGRRVVAMSKAAHGGFAEYAVCPVVSTFEMPDDIPLPGAAALYFPFHLAWVGLFDRADLRAGESVLIHAAAGGSGSAAIQLAVHAGARVFATAGTEEKLSICRELGAELAINYNSLGDRTLHTPGSSPDTKEETAADFAEVVLEATNGRGVDVVFDNVGEAVMARSMDCLAYNGRYLMMGFASDKTVADEKMIVPRRIATGNFKLCGVLLAYAEEGMAKVLKKGMGWNFVPNAVGERVTREIVSLVRSGKVKPVVGRIVEFDEIPTALSAMANRETVGRTIVKLY
jgi:NADPH2:quinone reductase